MKKLILCITMIVWVLLSCKPNVKHTSDTTTTLTDATETAWRQKDMSHLTPEVRSKWTFLTLGHLQKQVEVKGGNILNQDSTMSQWIKFYDDNTYEAGDGGQLLASGTWTYDHDKTTLELIQEDDINKRAEYTVMHKTDVVIFVGTSKYNNNGRQIKWERVRE